MSGWEGVKTFHSSMDFLQFKKKLSAWPDSPQSTVHNFLHCQTILEGQGCNQQSHPFTTPVPGNEVPNSLDHLACYKQHKFKKVHKLPVFLKAELKRGDQGVGVANALKVLQVQNGSKQANHKKDWPRHIFGHLLRPYPSLKKTHQVGTTMALVAQCDFKTWMPE